MDSKPLLILTICGSYPLIKYSINLSIFERKLTSYYLEREKLKRDYLVIIHDILEIFRAPTIKLEASSYNTITDFIPYIYRVLDNIDKCNTYGFEDTNPYLALGLTEVYDKPYNYYPIRDGDIDIIKTII
ncbi:hypothetical protein HI914_06654 [Erysiphe necator]|nr:hypothetical protein HI914_06654 [Erysiphe necator]